MNNRLKNTPALFVILCFASVSNMSGVAIWTMMVPYVQEHLAVDAAKFGLLGSVLVRGCLVAAMGRRARTGCCWRSRKKHHSICMSDVFATPLRSRS